MNVKWLRTVMALLLAAALLAACGGQKYEPQAINEETDRCAICKMAVKDDPHAAQIITKEGQSLKFDDIGCMNEWKTKNGTGAIGAEYVRDFRTKQWLKYEKAYYVYDPSLQTPMAYGIVSFEKKEDAEAFMKEEGTGVLMTAKELDGHSWARNREMMKMGGMGAHSHGENGERNEEHSGSGMGGSGGHR